MLELVKFIKEHANWEVLLQEAPYNLKIKRKENFILFYYDQLNSKFSERIVQESRGIILEDESFKPLCYSFDKFFNYGEGHASEIDWESAIIDEKIDGSMIKLWNYKGEWKVSTMANIDARDSELPVSYIEGILTFYDLFMYLAQKQNLRFDTLAKNKTYVFEIVSLMNQVVVPYKTAMIYHTGTRNMDSLLEEEVNIQIKKPKTKEFKSLADVKAFANQMPFNEEGFVVRDKFFNRVKIKSTAYVSAHHIKGGLLTMDRMLSIVKTNELDEYLTYYPEHEEQLRKVEKEYKLFLNEVHKIIDIAKENKNMEAKAFSEIAKRTTFPSIAFMYYREKLTEENLEKYLFEKVRYDMVKKVES